MVRNLAAVVLAISPAAAATLGADPASPPAGSPCDKRRDFCPSNAPIVWCDCRKEVSFEELAEEAAPTLWFSPDEPLMGTGRQNLPQKISCLGDSSAAAEEPAATPAAEGTSTAYYQIARVELDSERCPSDLLDQQVLPLGCVRKVAIRYYFYYELDVGVHSHWNDLERVELILGFDHHPLEDHLPPEQRTLFKATLLYAKGYAHEGEWQMNILHVKDPPYPALPLTVLVEEGKHASCPDRNGDGLYTPGYDVNVRTHDAWGVRDVFASRLPGARYHQEQFKPRAVKREPLPEEEDPEPARRVGGPRSLLPDRYRLVSALGREPCDVPMPVGEAAEVHPLRDLIAIAKEDYSLKALMVKHDFGAPPEVYSSRLAFHYGPMKGWANLKNFALGVSFSQSKVPWGLATFNLPWEMPTVGGWAFLRAEAMFDEPRSWCFGVGYTPSVSRFAEWYAAVNLRQRRDEAASEGWYYEGEGGLQARVLDVTARVGLAARISGYDAGDARLTFQLMLGPWSGGTVRGRD